MVTIRSSRVDPKFSHLGRCLRVDGVAHHRKRFERVRQVGTAVRGYLVPCPFNSREVDVQLQWMLKAGSDVYVLVVRPCSSFHLLKPTMSAHRGQ